MDPLAEKYAPFGTYGYCIGNPVRFVDTNGEKVVVHTEINKLGHTWISIQNNDNLVVFSYGRYDGVFKTDDSSAHSLANGNGVLLKLDGNTAKDYFAEKEKDKYISFEILDLSDDDVFNYFNNQFISSATTPRSGSYYESLGHVIDVYNLLSNNCTTKVCDGLNELNSKALEINGQKERFIYLQTCEGICI